VHHGADPTAISAAGYSPLHYAAANDMIEVLEMLLEKSVAVDARTPDGKTPLDLAREKGSERSIARLEEEFGKEEE
jgi:ankyrin repeat protein